VSQRSTQESQIDGNQRHVPKVTSAKAVHLRLQTKKSSRYRTKDVSCGNWRLEPNAVHIKIIFGVQAKVHDTIPSALHHNRQDGKGTHQQETASVEFCSSTDSRQDVVEFNKDVSKGQQPATLNLVWMVNRTTVVFRQPWNGIDAVSKWSNGSGSPSWPTPRAAQQGSHNRECGNRIQTPKSHAESLE
jgi:hypothetical protein